MTSGGAGGDQEGLRLGPELLSRLGRFTARLEGLRKRREGGRGALEQGPGEDWVGYRSYRPGDDVRGIDWNLLARLDQPFVKLQTRSASERWTLWVDASGSMAVGDPSKFQTAVECALGLASLGLARGAQVRVVFGGGRVVSGAGAGVPEARLRRAGDLGGLLERLDAAACGGESGLAQWLAREGREAGRVVLIGDLLDLGAAQLARHVRPGVEWIWMQLLALRELELGAEPGRPAARAPLEFVDPEGRHEARRVALHGPARAEYQRRLSARLEEFGRTARRHRIRYGCFEAGRPFEDLLSDLLR